jgi:hypothetical protein
VEDESNNCVNSSKRKLGIDLCICLFVYSHLINCFSYPTVVTIADERAANLDLHVCLALMDFRSEGSFSIHIYCDTGPGFIRSHLKDQHPRPTVRFEPGTQESSDLCASALTTAPRG